VLLLLLALARCAGVGAECGHVPYEKQLAWIWHHCLHLDDNGMLPD
jgi:hypothetical protein